jgi:hypothetical protein
MAKVTQKGVITLLFGALLLGPGSARAEEAEDASLRDLEARIFALEDKLAASEATVARQQAQIGAGPESAGGKFIDFLREIEFGGHITASYLYNFNNPDQNVHEVNQPYFQFNRSHNTFEFDAAKIEIGKPTSGSGTAGFQLDLLFGANNHILCLGYDEDEIVDDDTLLNPSPGARTSDRNVCVQQAYVAYNTHGINFKVGKFETLLGYELIDSPYNHHITHGLAFTWAIPLAHVGLLADGNLFEDFEWALGVVNGFNNAVDTTDNKGVLGRIGYSEDNWGVTLNAFVGSERLRSSRTRGTPPFSTASFVGDNDHAIQVYDLVASYMPRDDVELWMNLDYGIEDFGRDSGLAVPSTGDATWYSAAAGVAYDITERTSVALRGEFFRDDEGARLKRGTFSGLTPPGPPPPAIPRTSQSYDEIDMMTATLTLTHRLTENLQARLEYRHETYDQTGPENGAFPSQCDDYGKHDGGCDDTLDIAVFEVSYIFD